MCGAQMAVIRMILVRIAVLRTTLLTIVVLGLVLAFGSGCAAVTPALSVAELPELKQAEAGAEVADSVARVRESTITLPTYPVEPYQRTMVDPIFAWPYASFDVKRFLADAPAPAARIYRTLELENDYLRVTIVPELGGRVLQALHKASGARMFYENSVVKPTAWGPPEQRGWTAVGGLEWCLPVVEHGYAWGEEWQAEIVEDSPERAAVRVSTPEDGRALRASVTISLDADAASFTVQPSITNVTDAPLRFDYWLNAMLAPGDGHRVTRGLHFVFPTRSMLVHSTADSRLPVSGQRLSWPRYSGRDVSRLRTWTSYAGLFEAPAAHGPFAAVYDTVQDAGAVRAFPKQVATGSKLFALGGTEALDPALYTDDDGSYVEIHGGLAPTFAQQSALGPGETVSWAEDWYPVVGMGDVDAANANLAYALRVSKGEAVLALYPVRDLQGEVVLETSSGGETRFEVRGGAGTPIITPLPDDWSLREVTRVRVASDKDGTLLDVSVEP